MWFSKSTEAVLQELNVNPANGLTDQDALTRLTEHGANKLQAEQKKSIFLLFIAQLKNWLIYILLGAVVITLFMGEYVDAIIIMLVICINATLGVVQEIKAGKAIEALQKLTFPKALVRRNGVITEIDSEKVVPGDILILDAGRIIAADMRLIESVNLQVDESSLTGESVPAVKDATLIQSDLKTPLGDRFNLGFMSTIITGGRGVGVVVGTGMKTEIGKIASIINTEVPSKTPLEVRLDNLGKTLGIIAIVICVLIFIIAMFQGRDLSEMFLLSVSLAVAAIPEGLAAIVAVVLSIGVTKLSKKNAIIKKLSAVETLGSLNIICSDKTGTLTQNKMTVTSGFTLEGVVSLESENNNSEELEFLAKSMILSSDASYENGEGTGDPTEIALLVMGDKMGIDRKALQQSSKRIDEAAFDSERKLMSTLIEENGKFIVYTKGAIDNLINICTQVLEGGKTVPLTDAHKKEFLDAAVTMSDQALRTLGAAYKPVEGKIAPTEMEKGLILVGVVGMIDPPRAEVKESILKAKNAGVETLMITGDHKNTAFAIAHQLRIAENIEQTITGQEIDELTDLEFSEQIDDFHVFARVSPEHKVKIVRALKSHGNIVSMTGDGVNDAPSLNTADIGVAMGITGTDVAKGASDMILTDDNFSTIVTAIEQGRNIYNNIKKSVIFLITCNLGEVITIFVALIIGWKSPLLATQLLWINLITDSLPAIALGMDPGNPDVMKEKPRPAKESFFAHGAGIKILLGGLLIGILTILAYYFGYYEHGYSPFDKQVPDNTLDYAGTMAFMVLVVSQLVYSLTFRDELKSIFTIGLFTNKYLVGAILLGLALQLVVVGIPAVRSAFHLQMPDIRAWGIIFGLGIIPLLLNEFIKIFFRTIKKGK
ncbi:MAG: ATPase [Ignavibacteriae bacterium HGW-Ignavibacteriae-1]|jgi:Ca2+-transporting ATPase|nr:MAG: ATPase [Ignavibacteriae bacterium HGW-Ignavibacteriae-1]